MDDFRWTEFGSLYSEPSRNGLTKPKRVRGQGFKFINMGEIFRYDRLRRPKCDRAPLTETEKKTSLLKPNDLLFARQSLVLSGAGKCSIFLSDPEEVSFESHIIRIRINAEIADPLFYYYLFRSKLGRSLIESIIEQGAGASGIRGSDLQSLHVPCPPYLIQRQIADFLSTLDDKIELNHCMNETLEAMAQAIFKDWFVDFGPTRAKVEGRERYLVPELWDLFPDALDDKGKPIGWYRSNLGNEISILETGKRPRGGVAGIKEGIPSVGAESIVRVGEFDFSKTKYVPREFFSNMRKGHVSDGDVLIYKDGGKPGELRPAVTYVSRQFPFTKFCINEHVFRIRTESFSQPLLYCLLSTDDVFWQMRERATGVAQPGLNRGAVKSIDFTLPDDKRLLSAAAALIDSIIDGCNDNSLHSRTLAQTRDLLLPKLMSGEIRLPEAEKAVEAVA